jgi:two-component system, OmpR family, response regulator
MNAKPTILIVDDDEDIVTQLTLVLKSDGYDVQTGHSQRQGEELLLGLKPDLAILDLMMEQMDSGFVLAYHLKRLYGDVPVILLTAVAAATGLSFVPNDEDARSWVKADLILDKPVRAEQIRSEVARLLGDKACEPKDTHT